LAFPFHFNNFNMNNLKGNQEGGRHVVAPEGFIIQRSHPPQGPFRLGKPSVGVASMSAAVLTAR
jgi:hypothetical protein